MKNFIHRISPLQKEIFVLMVLLFLATDIFATHNRAGEITYRNLGGFNYEVTIVTYTKISAPADRPELEIFWGDGQKDTIPRTNGNGVQVAPDIKRNEYVNTHVYPGPADYVIYFVDQNRNQGVINILGSVNTPFYVQSLLAILPVSIPNSSPVLLQPPIDDGVLNQIFIHNPNAFDPDGDSLSYELTPCMQGPNQVVPTFSYPQASSSFSINSFTGDLIWNAPVLIGEYNMAMIIREWRTIPGVGLINIGYVTRDLQVNIIASSNRPPVISNVIDTCIEAGSSLFYIVTATDPDNDKIVLTASGGPFQANQSPAQFTSTPANGIVSGSFSWSTVCAHVQKNPYSVVFKATSKTLIGPPNDSLSLADIETAFIKVIGPSPKNPLANPQGNSINLSWNQSACTEAIGYKIYRHIGYYGFIPSYCETGVPAYTGYSLIQTQIGLANTTYVDNNNGQGLATGITYCYMIVAIYADGAESYASLEVCANLNLDIPVITNADIISTDNTNGNSYVTWSKPSALDTVQWQGPYRYTLQRATSAGNYTDVISFTDLNDTTFTDTGLNTADNQYRYKLQFYNETNGIQTLIGTTQIAYSIFLTVNPGDNRLFLSWNVNVPWSNTSYVVYKQNALGVFDSIATVQSQNYIDSLVQNGTSYCYKIKSVGTYGLLGLLNPIINFSEEECQVPVDIEPPCVPDVFSAKADCSLGADTVRWGYSVIPDSCKISDIKSYNLFFIPAQSSDTILVAVIADPAATFYVINDSKNLAGCFFMTVTDTSNNTSETSALSCVEGCPRYVLPNVFTPDQNGINDLFHPIEYDYSDVKDIEIKIYNRWGGLVFESVDPDINWNGKRNNTGQEVPEGVYYYICIVNEIFLEGVKSRTLTGFIQVIRGTSETHTQ